jgi:hypothetical protein
VRIVDRRGGDDDDESENDAELAEAKEQLRDDM